MGSTNGRTETHGTLRLLSKECRVFGHEGLHLVGTRYVGRAGKAEYLLILPRRGHRSLQAPMGDRDAPWCLEVSWVPFGGNAPPRAGPYAQVGGAALAGLRLGASGWAVAPGKRGSAAAQKPWTPGEERLSVRTGSPAPVAAPRGRRGGSLRALSKAPTRASASFVGYRGLDHCPSTAEQFPCL